MRLALFSERAPSFGTSTLLTVTLLLGLSACNWLSSSGAARDDLALVPGDASAVFMLNLKQARSTHLWQKLLEARDKDPNSQKEYQEFVSKCHLDPLKDLDSIFLAFPSNVQKNREYALLLRGRYIPDDVVACVRKTAALRHQTTSESDYNGVRIVGLSSVGMGSDHGPALAVLGKRAIVIAGDDWMHRIIDLYQNKKPAGAASENKELQSLLFRTRQNDAFFWAGQVPAEMAERLRSSAQLGAAASLHSISGSVDLSQGLRVHADLDLGSEADASTLLGAVNTSLNGLRQDSRLQLMGLSSYLDTLQVGSRKATFVLDLRLTEKQVDDLTNRLAGLTRSLMF